MQINRKIRSQIFYLFVHLANREIDKRELRNNFIKLINQLRNKIRGASMGKICALLIEINEMLRNDINQLLLL